MKRKWTPNEKRIVLPVSVACPFASPACSMHNSCTKPKESAKVGSNQHSLKNEILRVSKLKCPEASLLNDCNVSVESPADRRKWWNCKNACLLVIVFGFRVHNLSPMRTVLVTKGVDRNELPFRTVCPVSPDISWKGPCQYLFIKCTESINFVIKIISFLVNEYCMETSLNRAG